MVLGLWRAFTDLNLGDLCVLLCRPLFCAVIRDFCTRRSQRSRSEPSPLSNSQPQNHYTTYAFAIVPGYREHSQQLSTSSTDETRFNIDNYFFKFFTKRLTGLIRWLRINDYRHRVADIRPGIPFAGYF